MSTLRVTTISNIDSTKSATAANVIDGASKAWVNFKGTDTVTRNASFNVSSVTDNGTGDYTVNFATAFADANYCVTFGGAGNASSPASSAFAGGIRADVASTTTSVRFATGSVGSSGGIATDMSIVNVAVFR